MKPQTQRIISNIDGDCFGACVASILELDDWPNYHDFSGDEIGWLDRWNQWLKPMGLGLVFVQSGCPIYESYWICAVPSKLFPGSLHAVVMSQYDVVWNPNPITKEIGEGKWFGHYVFCALHPEELAKTHSS